jgi:hypothetical protein
MRGAKFPPQGRRAPAEGARTSLGTDLGGHRATVDRAHPGVRPQAGKRCRRAMSADEAPQAGPRRGGVERPLASVLALEGPSRLAKGRRAGPHLDG